MSDNTKARKNKMVAWNADWYKSLSDDDCIICLTEKQVYLVGQIIEQLTWVNTRWNGDTSGLDFKAIAGNLEYRLEERMTCELLTQISTQLTALSTQVQNLTTQVATNSITINFSDTLDDVIPVGGYDTALGGDTECDKDILWGGVVELVDYIHNNNLQLMNELEQVVGNTSETIATAISGTPIVSWFPFDEVLLYASNLVDNMKDEYETITDEDFINTVKCELFCLVANINPCNITLDTLLNWVNTHNVLTIDRTVTRIADMFQLMVNGTFASNDIFWAITGWQLVITAMGERFLSANGLADYEAQLATGYNSPDADWSIICDECPEPVNSHPQIGVETCPQITNASGTLEAINATLGIWRITSTTTPTPDEGVTLQRVGGGKFRCENLQLISGSLPPFFAWRIENETCVGGLEPPDISVTPVIFFSWTNIQGSPFVIQFKFIDVD